jgi:hypothetical protein
VRRKSPTSAWRRSTFSTRKNSEHLSPGYNLLAAAAAADMAAAALRAAAADVDTAAAALHEAAASGAAAAAEAAEAVFLAEAAGVEGAAAAAAGGEGAAAAAGVGAGAAAACHGEAVTPGARPEQFSATLTDAGPICPGLQVRPANGRLCAALHRRCAGWSDREAESIVKLIKKR